VTGAQRLHPIECFLIDEELVRTGKGLGAPLEETNVEPILQNQVDVAAAHGLSELSLQHFAKGGKCVSTVRIKIQNNCLIRL
jgi:hypothetical protein